MDLDLKTLAIDLAGYLTLGVFFLGVFWALWLLWDLFLSANRKIRNPTVVPLPREALRLAEAARQHYQALGATLDDNAPMFTQNVLGSLEDWIEKNRIQARKHETIYQLALQEQRRAWQEWRKSQTQFFLLLLFSRRRRRLRRRLLLRFQKARGHAEALREQYTAYDRSALIRLQKMGLLSGN